MQTKQPSERWEAAWYRMDGKQEVMEERQAKNHIGKVIRTFALTITPVLNLSTG